MIGLGNNSLRQWTHDGFPYFEKSLQYVFSTIKNYPALQLYIIDALPSIDYENTSFAADKVILTNNCVEPGTIPKNKFVVFPKSWYGIYAGRPTVINRQPVKDFNCFINRMDPIRQSWLYLLVRKELFDNGFISFNMDISRHLQQKQYPPGTSTVEIFEQQFEKQCNIFREEHNFLKTKVPYKNFQDDVSLGQIIMDSKFSIVLETYHDDNRFITFSEKIFRCLKLPRPWVMHAEKGAVSHLRNIGFDVLDDIVDHSYDDVDFTIERQSAILDQCKKLSALDIPSLSRRLSDASEHNCELLEIFYNTWVQDVDDTFSKALILSKAKNGF